MRMPEFIQTPKALVHRSQVRHIDLEHVDEGFITVHYGSSMAEEVSGVLMIEILMQLRPTVLEGRRFRWAKHTWIFHNLVAHPVMQLLALCHLYGPAMWLHDATVPKPIGVRTKAWATKQAT